MSVRYGRGRFSPGGPAGILLTDTTPRNLLAARQLASELRLAPPSRPVTAGGRDRLAGCILLETVHAGDAESYRLIVTPDRIRVVGDGAPGLFYGIQTLRQLVRRFGARIPACTIRDAPAFPNRGYSLDISRGRVPRIETLFALADRLAHLKINQLQLYVEHVFAFRFDPSISRGCDPLTRSEILALDRYCRDRFIRLVPSLACFGHMGRILSLPAYRKLAELEWPAADWTRARWIQRLRGATINPCRPESRALLRRMLDEYLPLFSAPLFNLCGDETYDLGKGPNARRVRREGIGPLYLQHMRFLRREAARHGKTLLFWGDVMQRHPEAIPDIPKDCTALDWGYDRHTDFRKVRRFVDAGLDAYVCPSTRGYRVVFNEVEEARANIAGYAREGIRAGAAGLLTTDWGDMGHFNMPGCSLHGMALGAAMAWNPRADERQTFDRAFSRQLFGDTSGRAAALYRAAGAGGMAGWPMMLTDPPREAPSRAQRAKALRALETAEELARSCRALARQPSAPVEVANELALAVEALAFNARHTLLPECKPAARRELARDMISFIERYSAVWLQSNKRSGLPELQRAFRRAARRSSAGRQDGNPLTPGDLP